MRIMPACLGRFGNAPDPQAAAWVRRLFSARIRLLSTYPQFLIRNGMACVTAPQ